VGKVIAIGAFRSGAKARHSIERSSGTDKSLPFQDHAESTIPASCEGVRFQNQDESGIFQQAVKSCADYKDFRTGE